MDAENIKQLATGINNMAKTSFQSGIEQGEKPLLAKIERLQAELKKWKEQARMGMKSGLARVAEIEDLERKYEKLNSETSGKIIGLQAELAARKEIIEQAISQHHRVRPSTIVDGIARKYEALKGK